ncbi:acyltransferase family protein [Luteimonas sp. R10]|uniref:acyltransferase family protein n=1 Tax=Luteimonas sp. R10 TaxID=3108176 RepID=UPI00308CD851|nr:acyltransferase family protein [Luteimonas sp. R10]
MTETAADSATPARGPLRAEASGLAGTGFRPEIQGLRAIAVLIVLVYHIWPQLLPGGYVGVDVFFVISGYLITGILFKDFQTTGRIAVREFYARRIRRLLPAAALVLVVVAFLMPLLPQTRWEGAATGIIASTLYVQNWWLASQAVDYLAAEAASSPVMHFWSLSVEEQYYIVWPLLLLMMGLLPAVWRSRPARLFTGLVAVVTALSLLYSVWLTSNDPGMAYFSTVTRAWELGVGGLLAVTTRWRRLDQRARDVLGIVGVAMIGCAAFAYSSATHFPGYAAALPVAGAALVLMARDSVRRVSAYSLLRTGPFQYFGDISYSLYLWHWPVIVVYQEISGREPGLVDGIAIFAVSCALAHQTKMLVEDHFRHRPKDANRYSIKPFGLAAVCIVVSLIAGWSAPRVWSSTESVATASDAAAQPNDPVAVANPGAATLVAGVSPAAGPLLPAPEFARDDLAQPYLQRCMSRGSSKALKVCEYGDAEGGIQVALVGDTYAVQWQPALTEVARVNKWGLKVMAKTGCALGDVDPADQEGKLFSSCVVWRDGMTRRLIEIKPDLVLVAQSPSSKVLEKSGGETRAKALAAGLETFYRKLDDAGIPVAFIRSTPTIGGECKDATRIESCSRVRDRALPRHDPMIYAARTIGEVPLVDLTDAICTPKQCDAVVGNVVVYRGSAHLTATYAQTLAPAFATQLDALGVVGKVNSPKLEFIPAPTDLPQRAMAARRDNPDLYADGCHVNQRDVEPSYCVYGDKDSEIRIVLAGDSHAGQWLPALQEIADSKGWALYSFTKSACAFSEAVVQVGGREYSSCTEWNGNLMLKLAELRPAVVVTSQSRGHRAFGTSNTAESQAALAQGLHQRWRELESEGMEVIVIADTPWMKKDVPDCLSSPRYQPGACNTPLENATSSPDSVLAAVMAAPEIQLINLNEKICREGDCPAMVGDRVIWRDKHHLAAGFVRTLAPELQPAIESALREQ